jgi:hypothetical protein
MNCVLLSFYYNVKCAFFTFSPHLFLRRLFVSLYLVYLFYQILFGKGISSWREMGIWWYSRRCSPGSGVGSGVAFYQRLLGGGEGMGGGQFRCEIQFQEGICEEGGGGDLHKGCCRWWDFRQWERENEGKYEKQEGKIEELSKDLERFHV